MEIVKIYNTGQIVNYQNYDVKDRNLIISSFTNTEMDPNTDLIEVIAYGENNDFLDYSIDVRTYKIVQGSINPVTGFTNRIELDPQTDAGNLNINRGRVNLQYNFLKPLFNSNNVNKYWIKQISPSRTELKLTSQFLSNDQIRTGFANFQTYTSGKPYYVDFYINFGENRLVIANNAAIVEENGDTFLLIKLYDPLPIEFSLKDTLWICDKISDSAIYTLDIQVPAEEGIVTNALRGPNWRIKVNDVQGQTTPYYNYNSLFSSDLSSSMQQLASYYEDKGIELNVDYTNFANFVHFSSAKERVNNFVYKLGLIEQYEQEIQDAQLVTNANSFAAAAISQSVTVAQQKIDRLIEKFDVYEYYLYYSSESFAWPKSTSTKPYALYSVTSSEASLWLGDSYTLPSPGAVSILYSASLYDDTNKDKLSNSIPQYLLDDLNNQPYVTFIDMVGQHFDNVWLYYKDVSNRYSSFNSPNFGISKDIIADALRSFGFNLYTNTSVSDNLYYTIFGMNPDGSLLPPTGSEIIDNYVTSSIDTLSPKDLNAEIYKRLYHNMTYLLKTKGTQRGVKALICSYGIPEEILTVNEFGGNYIYTGSGLLEINDNKIRYFSTGSELSNPVLSPFVTIQQYSTDYRINSETIEAGFSPADQINRNIVSSSGFFSMDQLVGNPTHQYLPFYPDLKTYRDNYFASYNYPHSIWEYIRIIKYYNNSLFKTIKDWVPAKSSPSTGIIVKSHILERNKYARTEPSMSFDNNISESIDMVEIGGSAPGAVLGSTQYTENVITPLGYAPLDYAEDKAKITGRLSGSFVQATDGQAFDQSDFSTTESGSVEVDFPANYQNIVTSTRSKRFLELDYAYNQNTPVNLGLITQSINNSINNNFNTYNDPYAPYADIQDYNYATRAFTDARYYGSRVSSRFYNVYTSASTGYAGDSSYGKTAAIDRNSVKFAIVRNIPNRSLNFLEKTQISIKYLVDENSNLLELNYRNNNLFEVQNTFKSGTPTILSLSDVNKPSNQRTLDGTKPIFLGGFRCEPYLVREANVPVNLKFTTAVSAPSTTTNTKIITSDEYTWYRDSAFPGRSAVPFTQQIEPWTEKVFNGPQDTIKYLLYTKEYPAGFRSGGVRLLESGPPFAYISYGPDDFPYTKQGAADSNNKAYKKENYFSGPTFTSSTGANPETLLYTPIRSKYYILNYKFNNPDNKTFDSFRYTANNQFEIIKDSNYTIDIKLPIYFGVCVNDGFGEYTEWKVTGFIQKSSTPTDESSWWQESNKLGVASLNNIITEPGTQRGLPQYNASTITVVDNAIRFRRGTENYIEETTRKLTFNLKSSYTGVLKRGEFVRFVICFYDTSGRIHDPAQISFRNLLVGLNCKAEGTAASDTVQVFNTGEYVAQFNMSENIEGLLAASNFIEEVTGSLFTTSSQSQNTLILSQNLTSWTDLGNVLQVIDSGSRLEDLYTPILEPINIEVGDLVRLSSISSQFPAYYTVSGVSTISQTITTSLYSISSINPIINQSTLRFMIEVSQTAAITNQEATYLSNMKSLYNSIGIGDTIRIYDYADVNGNLVLDGSGIPLPTLTVKVVNKSTLDVSTPLTYVAAIIEFTPSSPNFIDGFFQAKVDYFEDKKVLTLNTNIIKDVFLGDQSFALFKIRPDETSVIINFRKSLGEVSPTLLLPFDLQKQILENVGEISNKIDSSILLNN